MGEGLGAGGHATRRQTSQRVCRRFVPTGCKKFFVHGGTSPIAKLARTRHLRCALRDRGRSFGIDATGPAAAKPRRGKGAPSRRRQWQVHMPAVGKFEIARRHSQAPACAAAAFVPTGNRLGRRPVCELTELIRTSSIVASDINRAINDVRATTVPRTRARSCECRGQLWKDGESLPSPSRIFPTWANLDCPNSGEPEFGWGGWPHAAKFTQAA